MKDGLFKILDNLNKVYEKNKWERRKKKRKCEGTFNNANCELPTPTKSYTYNSNFNKLLDNEF